MTGEWTLSKKLAEAPQRIRPETHWFHENRPRYRVSGDPYGRVDGSLWFSLQLTLNRAEELCDAFAGKLAYCEGKPNEFASLVRTTFEEPKDVKQRAVMMAPAGHAALRFAIKAARAKKTEPMLGTDILVHPEAFAELEKLSRDPLIEISDAGLAVEGEIAGRSKYKVYLRDGEEAKSNPDPIPADSPVIIAIIDDGIGIANQRFREPGKKETRIKRFLDLALIGEPTAKGGVDELLGRSWRGTEIDNLLGQDEDQVYRALGLIDPLRDLRQPLRAALTHGTHVLDLAAGYDLQNKAEAEKAAKRPIIAVQLPTQVAENRSDTWLPQCLKRALDWILVKADELSAEWPGGNSRRLPLVVNGSFASMAGPQDGYSDVEKRITQFIETYRDGGPEDLCTFVLAAGNSLQLRGAARMDIAPEGVGKIPWRLLPDDKTPNFVQIWLPEVNDACGPKKTQQVEVSLIPPRDIPENQRASQLNKAIDWKIGENVGARIYHQCFPRPHGSRECITIATRPTADDQISEPVVLVPSGLWQIRVKNLSKDELRNIDLRVHRDDPGMFSRSGARQSYFDDPNYVMFDPRSGRIINDVDDERRDEDKRRDPGLRERGYWRRVTRQGTLSSYVYAKKGVLAVGGYRRFDGEPATYSSAGRQNDSTNGRSEVAVSKESSALVGSSCGNDAHNRTRDVDGNRFGPDLAAVSEESPALTGVLAAGTYSGSAAILAGTSVAAPQITRALADQIAPVEKDKAAVTAGVGAGHTSNAENVIITEKVITGGAPGEGLPFQETTKEQENAVAKLKSTVTSHERALAGPQGIIPADGHFKAHRRLRDGVGRLPFTFRSLSYPKRSGD